MAEENKSKIAFCPNCHQPAIKQGNEIICESCDATFAFRKTGGAKVKETGKIEELDKRLSAVESQLGSDEPDQQQEPPESQDEQLDEPTEEKSEGPEEFE